MQPSKPPVFIDSYLEADPYRYHPSGSPYLGLSLLQQKALARIRRPKGRTPAGILKQLREPSKEDYEKLVLACAQALIFGGDMAVDTRLDRITVDIELIYNYRRYFKKSFPRVFPVAYKDWSIICRFRVDRLLGWLHSEGHSKFTARQLRKQLWAIAAEQDRLNFVYDYGTNQSINEVYADIIGDAERQTEKAKRGRRHYRKKQKELDSVSPICDNVVSEVQHGEGR